MLSVEALEKRYRGERRLRPFRPLPEFTDDGLMLGRETWLGKSSDLELPEAGASNGLSAILQPPPSLKKSSTKIIRASKFTCCPIPGAFRSTTLESANADL